MGWVTASSASTSEPQIESTPPTTHASRTIQNPVSSWATEWGERKMPEPMMLPTVIAVAAYSPIWRLSSTCGCGSAMRSSG